MRTTLVTCRCVLAVTVVSRVFPAAPAEIPQVISYQGRVTDPAGMAVPDGDYAKAFAIWDCVSGGASLWSSGSLTVPIH